MPNEVIEKYRTREITAVNVAVYAALCSLRREYDGVRVSQKRLAAMCGVKSEKTVAKSVERLYNSGLIVNIITPVTDNVKKYETSIYQLKLLPDSGFFLAPRAIFIHTQILQTPITPKMFAIYLFMCRACSTEYMKSWNSYNDIRENLGFCKGQKSEIMRLISRLVICGLLKKTVRQINGVFVDNIYRVTGYEEAITPCKAYKTHQKEKSPVGSRTQFKSFSHNKETHSLVGIVSPLNEKVKRKSKKFDLFFYSSG